MTGIIARVMGDKGFGFVKGEDGVDYFFHRSDVNGFFNDLVEDFDRGVSIHVTFDKTPSPKGPRAGNLTRKDAGVVREY